MQLGHVILNLEFTPSQLEDYALNSSRCIEKFMAYLNKLEIQSAKVAYSLEDEQTVLVENIV